MCYQVTVNEGYYAIMIFQAVTKYAVFSGRATRSEYWLFVLLSIVATNFGNLINPKLGVVVSLGLLIPAIAVAVRRLHDIGKSGWWYLLILIPFVGIIVILVWFCKKGTEGDNNYGTDPLSESNDSNTVKEDPSTD